VNLFQAVSRSDDIQETTTDSLSSSIAIARLLMQIDNLNKQLQENNEVLIVHSSYTFICDFN